MTCEIEGFFFKAQKEQIEMLFLHPQQGSMSSLAFSSLNLFL